MVLRGAGGSVPQLLMSLLEPVRPEKSSSLPVRLRKIIQDLASDGATIHALTEDLRVNEGRMHEVLQCIRDGDLDRWRIPDKIDSEGYPIPADNSTMALTRRAWFDYDALQAQRLSLASQETKRLKDEATVLTDRQVLLYRERMVAAVLGAINRANLKKDIADQLRRDIYNELVRSVTPTDG